jgi:hypothetical protein
LIHPQTVFKEESENAVLRNSENYFTLAGIELKWKKAHAA